MSSSFCGSIYDSIKELCLLNLKDSGFTQKETCLHSKKLISLAYALLLKHPSNKKDRSDVKDEAITDLWYACSPHSTLQLQPLFKEINHLLEGDNFDDRMLSVIVMLNTLSRSDEDHSITTSSDEGFCGSVTNSWKDPSSRCHLTEASLDTFQSYLSFLSLKNHVYHKQHDQSKASPLEAMTAEVTAENIEHTPKSEQLKEAMRDYLMLICGIESSTFEWKHDTFKLRGCAKPPRGISVATYMKMVEELVQMGVSYKKVAHAVKQLMHSCRDVLLSSFLRACEKYLTELQIHIVNTQQTATLLQLTVHSHVYAMHIHRLEKIFDDFFKAGNKQAVPFDHLYDMCHDHDDDSVPLYRYLFISSFNTLTSQLHSWTHEGFNDDVTDTHCLIDCDDKYYSCYDERFWKHSYSPSKQELPTFLTHIITQVVDCVKSVALLKMACDSEKIVCRSDESGNSNHNELKNFTNDFQNITGFLKINEKKEEDGNIERIDSFCIDDYIKKNLNTPLKMRIRHLNKSLASLLFQKCSLEAYFEGIHELMMLQNYNFTAYITEQLCAGVLQQKSSHLVPFFLNGILQQSFDTLTPSQHNSLLPVQHLFSFIMDVEQSQSTSVDDLILTINPHWPINVVIHTSHLKSYRKIFKFLFKVKRTFWIIQDLYGRMCVCCKEHTRQSEEVRKLFIWRHKMHHFMHVLVDFLDCQVVRLSWHHFQQGFQKIKDTFSNMESTRDQTDTHSNIIDHLISLHSSFIDSIIGRSLLDKTPISSVIIGLLDLILLFSDQTTIVLNHYTHNDSMIDHELFVKIEQTNKKFCDGYNFLSKLMSNAHKQSSLPCLTYLDLTLNYNSPLRLGE